MGYRSEVAMVIVGPKDYMLKKIATLRMMGDKHMHGALNEMTLTPWVEAPDKLCFMIYEESVKWYLDYPDVEAFERIWQELTDADEDVDEVFARFLRIGEDPGDIEERDVGESDEIPLSWNQPSICMDISEKNCNKKYDIRLTEGAA